MKIVNLPLDNAVEPYEEARQPNVAVDGCKTVKFVGTSEHNTENTTAYENVLSQPPRGITHKQKLLWLQQRRREGLWVQCDDCDLWRYLPQVLDNHELPTKWYCWMNPDTSLATCTAPEVPICLYDEDDLIHAEYAAGSVVLARMPGFPWWPAMVCDCPDTEQYYWLDGFSDIPTHYNVVFFDSCDVTRAWMTPQQLKPFKNNSKLLKKSLGIKQYQNRLNIAITQANDAEKLPLSTRLAKFSFIARFKGKILTPKKINKEEKIRYRNMLKRKFNVVALSEESSEEEMIEVEKNKIKKKKNPKQDKRIVTKKHFNTKSHQTDSGALTGTAETLNCSTDLNSLAVQVDSDYGLVKSSEVSNTNKNLQINTIGDSVASENLQNQGCTNMERFPEESSDNSDKFDF